MSQERLGKASGIHPTWISHIESGRINPTWGNVRNLARGLGVPLGELADRAQSHEGESVRRGTSVIEVEVPVEVKVPVEVPAVPEDGIILDEQGQEELDGLVHSLQMFSQRATSDR
jgi:transcriptional regulator with XRE-family HTH domain